MQTSELSALLWDMDGTLVDTEPLWVECEADLMRQFGYEWGVDDARYCIGGPMEKVERYMSAKSKSDLPETWFGDQLILMMLKRLKQGIALMPGVDRIMSEARALGVKLALVSASRREVVDAVIEGVGLDFDFSISASEVQFSKPNPEAYLTAAVNLGSDLEQCIIFEDSPVGLRAGVESGALTLGVGTELIDHQNFISVGSLHGKGIIEIQDLHRRWRRETRRITSETVIG